MSDQPEENDMSRKWGGKKKRVLPTPPLGEWKVSFSKPLTNVWILKGIKHSGKSLWDTRLHLFLRKMLQHSKLCKYLGWMDIDKCSVLIVMVGLQWFIRHNSKNWFWKHYKTQEQDFIICSFFQNSPAELKRMSCCIKLLAVA